MAQFVLEILDGDRAGEVVPLGDAGLRIGRKPGNDVVIPDEKASGVHAELVAEGGRFVLRDLGSTNGTLMEGRKITEVVLGPGDVFQVGRVRLRLHAEGAAAGGDGGGLQVGRIDASRLASARGSRSASLLVVLLVVAVAVGGYLTWRSGRSGGDGPAGSAGPQPPLQVAGNRLPATVASCEAEPGGGAEEDAAAGWNLRLAGTGFHRATFAHTGVGAFAATRQTGAEGAGGAGSAGGDDGVARDFAVAQSEPFEVLPDRSLTVAAHLRTRAFGRGAVRLHFFAAESGLEGGGHTFHFRTGTPLGEHGEWTRVAAEAAVPPGTDRCVVEVVAVLPRDGSQVAFDDVAVTEAGAATGLAEPVDEAGAKLLGTGQSFAIRSMDAQRPVTLYGVAPVAVDDALGGLAAAGLLCLSDVGAALSCQHDERGCTLRVDGTAAIELAFPADNARTIVYETEAAGEPRFAAATAAGELQTRRVLLGDRGTRCLVELDEPGVVHGTMQAGLYRLELPVAGCRLQLGFRAERQRARELLGDAEQAAAGGRPGEALDLVRTQLREVPHDVEMLMRAVELRRRLDEQLADELARIAAELDEALFFETRGGFQRVIQQLDALVDLYGEHNLADAAAVAAMRSRAAERLAALDSQRAETVELRLQAMAAAFEQEQQPALAELVRDYVRNYVEGR